MEQDFFLTKQENIQLDFILELNGIQYRCNKNLAKNSSQLIFQMISKNPLTDIIVLDYEDKEQNFHLISDLFSGKSILFCLENIDFLISVADFLKFPELFDKSNLFKNYLNDIADLISEDDGLQSLITLENDIFSLTSYSLSIVKQGIEKCENIKIVCQIIVNACCTRHKDILLYLELIKSIEIIDFPKLFLQTLLNPFINSDPGTYIELPREVDFIIRQLIDKNLVSFDEIPSDFKFISFYLIDYLTEKNPNVLEMMFEIYKSEFPSFFENIDSLKANNWELHKKLMAIGENEDEISKIIREDNIDRFQIISSVNRFDFNSKIQNSVYGKYSYISRDTSLIEYAAFFGAINIFKFLLLNGAKKTESLAKYAVASGNVEIVRIVEQNGCSFNDTLEVAFNFSHSDIFEWILLNKYLKTQQLPIYEFLTKCVHQTRFSLLASLLEDGWNPNKSNLVIAAVEEDNLILLNFLLKINGIIVNIGNNNTVEPPLVIACQHHNIAIVERLLEVPGIDVNIRGVFYRTSISTVARNGDIEIAKLLLQQKDLYVNSFEEKRLTPFYVACSVNDFEMVKLLAQQENINVNEHTREDEKLTPLHISVMNMNETITEFLLGIEGIDVNAQTKEGKTPLHQACQRRNTNIVKMLLNHKDIIINITNIEIFFPG
ncbi:hypothetical protein TRFO_20532 [Tritrichomonas foetus]|uniref:Uncharacterized protein n=1 Tax=Tritrichomonas foetus TaxID=1144522 RepID=A0A1J4KFP3_9EUKA|nr:hypothetical protein TRFO_20532 [Tritrichomonas foetus]|eukprot:OHT10233.1 hypothetical protein TRFO_20532 [Tritrichomonas foetus]